MIEIHLALIFMITAAIIAVEARGLLSSIIAVGAVGIGLSMAFLLLKAPGPAMMQLAAGILSLIILVRATIGKDLPLGASGRRILNTLSTIVFMAIFLAAAYLSLKDITPFGNPLMRASRIFILCFILFLAGLYCILMKRNIIKIIIGIGIMEYAVNLLFILIGYRVECRAPIFAMDRVIPNMADPLPQTVVLISIVMGLAVMLMLVAIAVRIYDRYGTFDITKINRLKG